MTTRSPSDKCSSLYQRVRAALPETKACDHTIAGHELVLRFFLVRWLVRGAKSISLISLAKSFLKKQKCFSMPFWRTPCVWDVW
jgi:hypothetical protein